MDWLERLNTAIDYIEQNLDGKISIDTAARIACCSSFHFQRMFSYIANVPLAEYIRRRRMTKAAFEILENNERIIDLAYKYGYESPTSFTRAFASVHGVSPSAARTEGIHLKAYPKISFQITIKGEAKMDYRIEKKDEFRVVGVRAHFEMNVEMNFAEVPKLWSRTVESGMFQKIIELSNQEPCGVLGVCTCMNGKDFDYYIASSTNLPVPEGMYEYIVPAATWAIFECTGPMPQAIQQLQTRIISEWLPSSGYEYADAPDIEVYPPGDVTSKDYTTEVWLPVVKR